MPGTTPELIRFALTVVGDHEPCSANQLRRTLRQNGASVRAANETLLTLIRDGHVKRKWNGRLVLP